MVKDMRVKIRSAGQVFWCTNQKSIKFWTKIAEKQSGKDSPVVRIIRTIE